jgi:phosphopantetheinyl transferase
MIAPVWHSGPLGDASMGGLVWHVRLDDPMIEPLAQGAPLRAGDLRDLAGRPQSAMRALRRRLAKVLIARLAACHPDAVEIGRSEAGAPCIVAPTGWYISVAGRWPHALIGVSRAPLGVDIEPLDAMPPPEDALTQGERADLASATDRDRVARWTAKEAHAKLYGVAAQIDPSDIHTQADGALIHVSSPSGRSICHQAVMQGALCAFACLPYLPAVSAQSA